MKRECGIMIALLAVQTAAVDRQAHGGLSCRCAARVQATSSVSGAVVTWTRQVVG